MFQSYVVPFAMTSAREEAKRNTLMSCLDEHASQLVSLAQTGGSSADVIGKHMLSL